MMPKKTDDHQVKLTVIKNISDLPTGQINIDPGGQAQLFNIEDVLVPEGLENLAGFFNNRLKRTEEKLDKVSAQNERLANSLETVIPKFLDQSVNNVQRDIVFGQLKYGEKADVAISYSLIQTLTKVAYCKNNTKDG